MKVIVAGSRSIEDPDLIEYAIGESGFHVSELVSGCALGVDRLGVEWALEAGVPIKAFPRLGPASRLGQG
jgi:hypothetical protein